MIEAPPFQYDVNVRTLPRSGRQERFDAPVEVRERLARDNGVVSIDRLVATAHLVPWQRGGVHVTGRVEADIVQPCAVSGQPLRTAIEETIDLVFVPEGSALAAPRRDEHGEIVFDPLGDDLPEPFSGDSIDLAALWCEFLTLGIDPNARAPGATFDAAEHGDAAPDSPFAVLATLRKH